MNYEKYLNYLDYETEIEDAYHNLSQIIHTSLN